MKFVEEFTFSAGVAAPVTVGAGPIGTRIIHKNTDGDVKGTRIQGKFLGGCDWSLIGPDNVLRIDARAHIETHDDAVLYLQYRGLLGLDASLRKALDKNEGTGFGEQYCYIFLQLETGHEKYDWVNTTFFIGEGRSLPGGGVEYRVWRPS